jgi:hypothetical protein
MKCPQCNWEMAFNKNVFRGGFVCEHCGARLYVNESYCRFLLILSMLIGFPLPWVVGLPHALITNLGLLFGFLALLALGYPLSFLILMVILRTLPRWIRPPLTLRPHHRGITTLNLNSNLEGQDHGDIYSK